MQLGCNNMNCFVDASANRWRGWCDPVVSNLGANPAKCVAAAWAVSPKGVRRDTRTWVMPDGFFARHARAGEQASPKRAGGLICDGMGDQIPGQRFISSKPPIWVVELN